MCTIDLFIFYNVWIDQHVTGDKQSVKQRASRHPRQKESNAVLKKETLFVFMLAIKGKSH